MVTTKIISVTAIYISVMLSLIVFNIIYRNLRNYFSDKETIYITQENIVKKFKLEDGFKNKMQKYRRMGVLEKYPKMSNPIYYFGVHFLVGIIFAIVFGFAFNVYLSVVGFFVGYYVLDILFEADNKMQNEEISRNVMRMYESMYVQLSGGQFITNAVISTKRVVSNKRLLNAINEFEKDVMIYNKSTVEAIEKFERKFDNNDVLTFCVMVRQNEENGRVIDLLKDLLEQIRDSQSIAFDKKRERMDVKLTIVMLIIFAITIIYVLYLFTQSILADNMLLPF